MPDNNISKAQPSKAKGLGGVFPLRSKNAALLYMYRLWDQKMLFNVVLQLQLKYELKSLHFCSKPCFFKEILKKNGSFLEF